MSDTAATYIIIAQFFFCTLSFISLLQLLRTLYYNLIINDNAEQPLQKVIFYMTISLTIFSFALLGYYLPIMLTFDEHGDIFDTKTGGFACLILGRIGNLALISSVLWYAQMTLMLALVLCGNSISSLRKNRYTQHVNIWIISFLLWLAENLPIFFDVQNLHNYCWLGKYPKEYYRYSMLLTYIPVLFTLVLSIIVLSMALCQLKRRKTILDIALFSGCFVLVWTLPCAHAIAVTLNLSFSWVDWLKVGHYMALPVVGLFHYLVWISLSALSRAEKRYKAPKSFDGELPDGKQRKWHSSYIISTLLSKRFSSDPTFSSGRNSRPVNSSCGIYVTRSAHSSAESYQALTDRPLI